MNFDEAFSKLIGYEGGYSDDARDPGGKTRYGVTEAVARSHGYQGEMRDLPLETAKLIYHTDYWAYLQLDAMPPAVRYVVFDGAVNSGCAQSVRWLQRAVGVADDGILGPATLSKVQGYDGQRIKMHYLSQRLKFMAALSTWPSFGRGWARRIADLMEA